MHDSDFRGQEGFTLLETLIAFLILSAALAVAIQSIAQTSVFFVRAQTSAELRLKGRELLAELAPTAKSVQKRSGLIDDRIAWTWNVKRYDSERTSRLLLYVLSLHSIERPNAVATFAGLVPTYDVSAD